MYHSRSSINILVAVVLIFFSGTATRVVSVEGPPTATPPPDTVVWGYDAAKGTQQNDIRANFNLHRGRWWNYFERGSWYLAYGHYEAAECDFRVAVMKRPTDKRDARTYGMHFRDCFAHRELGITLYYQALQEDTKARRLSLLKESIEQLDLSITQAESSRAAYFLNLAKESLWKDNGEDVTGPSITVENANRIGDRWAIVFCNRRTVQLDIRVTDYQSGISAIWVDEKRLFVERSDRSIRRTVRVPVGTHDYWISIRAKDLVGNDSPPMTVRVEPDMSPPLILTTTYPDQMAPDDLVVVEYTARDNLGLSTIQIDHQKVNCKGRREYKDTARIKTDPDKSRMELHVMDLAGNTTKGFVDIPPRDSLAEKRVETYFRPARSAYFHEELWTTHTGPKALPAFFQDNTFSLAVRTLTNESQDMNPYVRASRRAASSATSANRLPVFEFDDYKEVVGGYRVRGNQYVVQGKVKYAADVSGIAVGESTIEFEPRKGQNVTLRFSEPVHLPNYGRQEIKIKALYDGDRFVPHFKPLTVQRVIDATTEPNSVYGVVILPLEQKYVPGNSQGVHWTPEMTYDKIKQVFEDCKLHDPKSEEFITRFDCSAMENLDPNKIDAELMGMHDRSPGFKVLELGKTLLAKKKDIKIDLGIWGSVTETPNSIEIKLNVVDMDTQDTLTAGHPIDIFTPKGKPEWQKRCVEGLTSKLLTQIPRVSGEITGKSDFFKYVEINRGKDDNIVLGTHLCIFRKNTDDNDLKNVAEAIVTTLKRRSSKAKVTEKDDGKSSFIKVWTGQMFITK